MTRQLTMIRHAVVVAAARVGWRAVRPDLQKIAKLRNPAALTEKAPAYLQSELRHEQGAVRHRRSHRDWAPLGADRFYNLVKNGFYDDTRFFRVLDGFMAQFGIHGNPAIAKAWTNARIKDDPVKQSNKRGYVTFATRRPEHAARRSSSSTSATTRALDKQGFAPFGQVTSGHGRRRQAVQRLR